MTQDSAQYEGPQPETAPPAAADVRAHLERVLDSTEFARAGRIRLLLSFLVEQSLTGHGGELKESLVGLEVFDRAADYNPKTDPVVRVTAIRLRAKLEKYYAGDGSQETIRIEVPKGSYVPVFTHRLPDRPAPVPEAAAPPRARTLRIHRRPLAILALFSVLAGSAALIYPAFHPVAHWTTRPFTNLPGYSTDPSFSPDGKKLAFSWSGGGGGANVMVMGLDQDTPERVVAHARLPGWSRDGRRIAFLRQATDTRYVVCIWDSVTKATRDVAEISERSQPDWTPDGQSIAVSDRETPAGPPRIVLLDVAHGGKRPITFPNSGDGGGDAMPAISPDGSQLAFRRGVETAVEDIWIQPLGAAMLVSKVPPKRLTNFNNIVQGIAWAGDGRSLFSSLHNGRSRRLWRIRVPGGDAEMVQVPSYRPSFPAVARAGNSLVYVTRYFDSNLWRLDLEHPEAPVELAPSNEMESGPSLSPDGRALAFRSSRTGADEIWLATADGRNLHKLTDMNGPVTGSARWSPDGSQIVFDSRPHGSAQVLLLPAAGGAIRTLTDSSYNCYVPDWSRDGKWIYFTSDRSGSPEIWRVRAGGGVPDRITFAGGMGGRESPDGQYVYFAKPQQDGLWRTPLSSGGKEELVIPALHKAMWGNWDFAPSGIYYVGVDARENLGELRLVDYATNRTRLIYTMTHLPLTWDRGLSISPDGKFAIFAQADRIGSDISLVEHFK